MNRLPADFSTPTDLASTPVSVIVTVKNEGAAIDRLLASLLAQERPPDEVVIVDGGSTDDTVARITRFTGQHPALELRCLVEVGANISRGRNLAIRAARHDLIAATDAGVTLPPGWLASLVRAFLAHRQGLGERATQASPASLTAPPSEVGLRQLGTHAHSLCPTGTSGPGEVPNNLTLNGFAPVVVSGFFLPDPQSVFEAAMGATVLPSLADIDPATFLPSSRSVLFTRAAWEAAGHYPEWLDYCEDVVYDLALRQQGVPFLFAPDAPVHFRPRSSLLAFWRQYYAYARGDGKANLWRVRHLIRYGTYLAGTVLLLLISAARHPQQRPIRGAALLALLVGAAAYTRRPYQRLWPHLAHYPGKQRLLALALVPVIRLVGDVAKMCGYPVGWWWRRHHRKN